MLSFPSTSIACIGSILMSTGFIFGQVVEKKKPEVPSIPSSPIPIHEKTHFIVKYIGITCGHMTLESRLEELEGRPAYHIVMEARNSKFFNKIYKVDARFDSWVDAETLSTLVYESVTTEKGETSYEHYEVDAANGRVVATEDGEQSTLEFAGGQVLDPLAFVFRLQALTDIPGENITLTLLTSKGAVETVSRVSGLQKRRTARGRRNLVEVEPQPVDGTFFSRKGEFSLWVEPGAAGSLYVLDFRLSFGRLAAKLD
ncbi:MAG: DUF3108 domain-containing protein [Thermoanaerobaculales bacterium]|nr:DUF3108 domain-containing protein [Thermoanaerobaculales bacterium]